MTFSPKKFAGLFFLRNFADLFVAQTPEHSWLPVEFTESKKIKQNINNALGAEVKLVDNK